MSFPEYSTLFTLGLMATHTDKPLRSFLSFDQSPISTIRSASREPSPVRSSSSSYLTSRRSRTSLRRMPSPGPAPSTDLPVLPSPMFPSSRPSSRASTISLGPITPPARHDELFPAASAFSPVLSPVRRRAHRSLTLAHLEGRSARPSRSSAKNFMSMSDDEDEGATMDEDEVSWGSHDDASHDADDEDEDYWPAHRRPSPRAIPTMPSLALLREPRGTRSKSFIDLCDAVSSLQDSIDFASWRSYLQVEVADSI